MTNLPASQQPAPIPEDLKAHYDFINMPPVLSYNKREKAFIERIGRAESAATAYALDVGRLEAALTALRDFMWSEGYADQTAVMRQADETIAGRVSTALREGLDDTRALRQVESQDAWACVDCGRPQEFCKCRARGPVATPLGTPGNGEK